MTFLTGHMTIKEEMMGLKLKFAGKGWKDGRGPGQSGVWEDRAIKKSSLLNVQMEERNEQKYREMNVNSHWTWQGWSAI